MRQAIALLSALILISGSAGVLAIANPAYCEQAGQPAACCSSLTGDLSYSCVTCQNTVGTGNEAQCLSAQPKEVPGPTGTPTPITPPSATATAPPAATYVPPAGVATIAPPGAQPQAAPNPTIVIAIIVIIIVIVAGYYLMRGKPAKPAKPARPVKVAAVKPRARPKARRRR